MALLDDAALQLADSLSVEQVPARLRCGSCNKLAVNALRLPCCDQSICEPCSRNLPEECPICSHSPVSAEDCNPNKSLRMTIKAFIKNEEKKRVKEAEPPVLAPAETAAPTQTKPDSPAQAEAATLDVTTNGFVNGNDETHNAIITKQTEDGQGDSMIPAEAARDEQNATAEGDNEEEEEEEDEDDLVIITTERPEHEMQVPSYHGVEEEETEQKMPQQDQNQMNGQQDFGFNQNQGFNNMGFNGMNNNFNPMMAMQNAMGMNFGMDMGNMMGKSNYKHTRTFPRSRLRGWQGMPGMGMDPSMMFGGMGGMGGMNDMAAMMNMGMGMNGMGGFGGMNQMGMNGGGAGFYPGNGGYNNQQNFGNHMNQNSYNTRGYGRPYNRGFGRGGRGFYGGRGRGGFQNYGPYQGQNQNYMNNQQHQQQRNNFHSNDENSFEATSADPGATARGSPSYEPMNAADGTVTDAKVSKAPTDAEVDEDANNTDINATNDTAHAQAEADAETESGTKLANGEATTGKPLSLFPLAPALAPAHSSAHVDKGTEIGCEDGANVNGTGESASAVAVPHDDHTTFNIEAYDQNYDQQYAQGYNCGPRGRGGFRGGRGGFRGANGAAYGNVTTLGEQVNVPGPAPPVNAPSGPKAMRQGLPNSGWYSRQNNNAAMAAAPAQAHVEADKPKNDDHSGSRSRSPSRTVDRKDRERSPYPSNGDLSDGSDGYHRDRKRKARDEDRHDRNTNGDDLGRRVKARSSSRDRDGSSRHRRDRDEDRHGSRSYRERSKERRKHRHRSRSPQRDSSVNGDSSESARRKSKSDRRHRDEYDDGHRVKDKDSSRKHSRREDDRDYESRDRAHDSSRHHRSSRSERDRDHEQLRSVVAQPQSAIEQPEEEFEFKIRGQSATLKKGGIDAAMGPPTTFGRERSDRRSSMQTSAPATPTTPAIDPYEADRIAAQKKREQAHDARRQSTQSLGKHGRDDDEVDVPTGPRGDSDKMHGGKRVKKDVRRHSAKFEGEIGDGYEERDSRRWR